MKMLVAAAAACVATSGCMQYRQKALNVTPAPSADAAVCPDMSHGCGKTVWALGWGVVNVGEPPAAKCGDVGLAEVTVRSMPLTFLVSALTVGLVSPRRIEWKCAAPTPIEGTLH